MKKLFQLALTIGAAAAITVGPSMAETKRKSSQDDGVQRAIAYQRAKDRADARQARLEARRPEHFTYAQPQNNPPNGLATEQKKDVLEKSADREAPPK